MALVGYTAAPSGGYVFERDDGQTLHAFGEEAEQLKSFIDRTRPPDRRTAQNMSGGYDPNAPFGSVASLPLSVPDIGPNMSPGPDPTPAVSVAPVMPPHGPGGAYVPESAPSPAPMRAQPVAYREDAGAAAAAPPSGSPAAGPGPDWLTPKEKAVYLLAPEFSPGRPEVTSADIEKQNAARRPLAEKQAVAGALVETPEEKADRVREMQAFREQRRASFAEMEAAGAEKVAAAEQARTNALNASIQADIDRRDALTLKARVEDQWNATNSALNREREAAANAKIDPNRLFREKGTGSVIASAIAQGLGAFGASLTNGQNYAKQIIDAAIDRDIAAQSDVINANRERTQNAINEFQRVYGLDREEAKLAVRSTANRYAASIADITAATIGTAEAKMQAAQFKADRLAKAMADDAHLSELYNGRLTTQYSMASPHAATRGGPVAPKPETIKKRADALIAGGKAIGESSDPDEVRAQAEKRKAEAEANKVAAGERGEVQEYGKRRAEVSQAESVLKQYVAAMGGTVDETGAVTVPEGDIPGTGAYDSRTPDLQDKHRKVTQYRRWLAANVGKALSGSSVSPDQQEKIDALLSENNEDGARRGAQILIQEIMDKRREIDASFGPKAVTQYEDNKDTTSREQTARQRNAPALESY